MAQLTDDCFAFGGNLTKVDEALSQLQSILTPIVNSEKV